MAAVVQLKSALSNTDDDVCSSVEALYEAQRYAERRLEDIWLPRFVASADFVARQRPSVSVGHVVDDVIAGHRRRKVHPVQRVRRTDSTARRPSLEVAPTALMAFQPTVNCRPGCFTVAVPQLIFRTLLSLFDPPLTGLTLTVYPNFDLHLQH